ncbi:MAG: glycoside hydrolase family 43 protein [Oliverpabstia sp.]
MQGYLFVYFTDGTGSGRDEQIYFSVSNDGLHWKDLNNGRPVLFSEIGEKGVRDPYIIKSEISGKYIIIATDLRMENGRDWEQVQTEGSKSIIIWESEDLIHWEKERMQEVGIPEAGCVWAPEAVYCKETESYLVFWASRVKEEKDPEPKHRIYASWTKDFHTFTPAVKYIEKDNHIIDTTIIQDGEYYYRFSKDETRKNIVLDRGTDLMSGPFETVTCEELEQLFGVEGPEAYRLYNTGKWCLIVDQFGSGDGYLPLVCDNLADGVFRILSKEEYDMGITKKRHGSVLCISEYEMNALLQAYGIEGGGN